MNRPLSQTQIDEINRRGPSGFGDFIARVLAGGLLHTQVWGGPGYGPAAPDNVSIHAPIVLTDQPTLKNTGLSAPDYARNVNITSDKASTGDVTVVGTDVEGGPISETVPDLGSGTKATVAAFATVSEIRWPAKFAATSAGTRSSRQLLSRPTRKYSPRSSTRPRNAGVGEPSCLRF
jgi:hypothetical protein